MFLTFRLACVVSMQQKQVGETVRSRLREILGHCSEILFNYFKILAHCFEKLPHFLDIQSCHLRKSPLPPYIVGDWLQYFTISNYP